jgi:hypothetical protein
VQAWSEYVCACAREFLKQSGAKAMAGVGAQATKYSTGFLCQETGDSGGRLLRRRNNFHHPATTGAGAPCAHREKA